jgi:hypothetical protein
MNKKNSRESLQFTGHYSRLFFDFFNPEVTLLLTQFPRFARAPEFALTPPLEILTSPNSSGLGLDERNHGGND